MPRIELPHDLPLPLSLQQQRAYDQLVLSVVQRNMHEFTEHLERRERQLPVDKRAWKLIKNREKIDIYQSRELLHPDILATSHSSIGDESSAPRVPLVKLLCVGTLVGSVEDAMLGSVSPTQLSMATRSLYLRDEFIQHEVLHDIKIPTSIEPFEYLGLKWALRPSAMARPRDLVYVEATGFYIMLRPDGNHERIGYVVYHSVECPDVPPLKSKGIARAKLSLCVFYRQSAADVVQVFGSISSDPSGQISTRNILLAVSRTIDCAFDRKLVWLLKKTINDANGSIVLPSKTTRKKWSCGQCARELAAHRTRAVCGICHTPVCSRCVKTKKLALGASVENLALVRMQVCTGCLTTVRHLDNAGQIALDEVLEALHRRPSSAWLANAANLQALEASPSAKSSVDFDIDLLTPSPARDPIKLIDDEDDSVEPAFGKYSLYYGSESSTPSSWSSPSYPNSPLDLDLERQRMLRMMNSLCLKAEETYSATMSLSSSTRFEVVLDD